MGYDLAAMARQAGVRRNITLRPIQPTQANATEFARIIAPAWRIWSDNRERIMAGYDPAPFGDSLTIDTADQISAAIGEVAREFLATLTVQITPALRQWAVRVERFHRSRWIDTINGAVGIDLSTVLTATPVQETLEAFIQRNVSLVRNISEQCQSRIADAVFRGYQQRLSASEVAKDISGAIGMGRSRARRIAADQNSKISAALDAERQAEAGIDKFRYRHGGKLHPRPWHKARDGNIYNWKTRKQIGGEDFIAADDMPGFPPFCSCRTQAYIDLMSEIE